MTCTLIDTRSLYGIASDRQSALRREAATAHAAFASDRPTRQPLPPTRGPLAALRRRLAGTTSFA